MTEQVDSAIRWGQSRLGQHSDSAKLDAEILLGFCLNKPRSYLYSWPQQTLDNDTWLKFQNLIEQRARPTPIAYLTGEREFYSLAFVTTDKALVPRPETELLVDTALALCPGDDSVDILELGTGTGIIAITIKKYRPDAKITATDISVDCLHLARQNATIHQVDISWKESDWFSDIPTDQKFDLILSNPPYIAKSDDSLLQGDLRAEPMLALSPGETGLEALENIITTAPNYLKKQGYLVLEHGYNQESAVSDMLNAQKFTQINSLKDDADLPRVSLGRMS